MSDPQTYTLALVKKYTLTRDNPTDNLLGSDLVGHIVMTKEEFNTELMAFANKFGKIQKIEKSQKTQKTEPKKKTQKKIEIPDAPDDWHGAYLDACLLKNVKDSDGKNVKYVDFDEAVAKALTIPKEMCGGITKTAKFYELRVGHTVRLESSRKTTGLACWVRPDFEVDCDAEPMEDHLALNTVAEPKPKRRIKKKKRKHKYVYESDFDWRTVAKPKSGLAKLDTGGGNFSDDGEPYHFRNFIALIGRSVDVLTRPECETAWEFDLEEWAYFNTKEGMEVLIQSCNEYEDGLEERLANVDYWESDDEAGGSDVVERKKFEYAKKIVVEMMEDVWPIIAKKEVGDGEEELDVTEIKIEGDTYFMDCDSGDIYNPDTACRVGKKPDDAEDDAEPSVEWLD